MESQIEITKTQISEAIAKEFEIQEKRAVLQNKMAELQKMLNDELFILNEENIEEGLFKNVKNFAGNVVAGVKNVGNQLKTNYQQGVDTNKLQTITAGIAQKQQELNALKQQYKFLTSQGYNKQTAPKATPVPRAQQGVIKKQAPTNIKKTAPLRKVA